MKKRKIYRLCYETECIFPNKPLVFILRHTKAFVSSEIAYCFLLQHKVWLKLLAIMGSKDFTLLLSNSVVFQLRKHISRGKHNKSKVIRTCYGNIYFFLLLAFLKGPVPITQAFNADIVIYYHSPDNSSQLLVLACLWQKRLFQTSRQCQKNSFVVEIIGHNWQPSWILKLLLKSKLYITMFIKIILSQTYT